MADLGAIGISYINVAVRVVPLDVTAATGTARLLKNPLSRAIFDCADAKSISARNMPFRCFVQDFRRITQGRKAAYFVDWKEIRGTVTNSSDVGISRRVLALTAQGQCVGAAQSAGDGTFTIVIDNCLDPVIVAALPDAGDVRNAVVKWAVTPVT